MIDTFEDALSTSERFLQNITDVDGIFQTTAKACIESAAEIMLLIDVTTDADPTVAMRLEGLWIASIKKLARLHG